MISKNILLVYLAFSSMIALAQKSEIGNQVLISVSDDTISIIRKAAQVKPSPRQLNWQKLELTAFFHFGINTFTNREWGDGTENPQLFNPLHLDAKQWVKTMKDAGFKQVIITAKHHDGFCLWPSKFTSHSVKNSPWKNGKGDVVKAVADACRYYKMGFGVYLSPWDRNYKDYGDTDRYNAYFLSQLRELLSNYGKIDEVWFDGANGTGPNGKKPTYHFNQWYQLIRKLQPTATIAVMGPDVRWVGTETGYGRTSEWSVIPADPNMLKAIAENSQKEVTFAPAGNLMNDDLGSRRKLMGAKGLVWYPAETDVSIREGWFHHPEQDQQVKSPQQLMDIYFASVGRNGVLLLNVPPDKNGLVHPNDAKSLKEWTFLRNELFATNLASAAVISNEQNNRILQLTDGKLQTYHLSRQIDSCTIQLYFDTIVRFDVLMLQENIAIGQRTEKFVLEYLEGNTWKMATEGTTIGYKRLLKFKTVAAKQVRLRILAARLNPAIAEIGMYQTKE